MIQWTKAKAPSIFHQYPKFSTDGFCGWNLCLILSAQSTCMFYLTIDWLRVKTLKATIIPHAIFFYLGQTTYDMIVSIYKTSQGWSKILLYVYITWWVCIIHLLSITELVEQITAFCFRSTGLDICMDCQYFMGFILIVHHRLWNFNDCPCISWKRSVYFVVK